MGLSKYRNGKAEGRQLLASSCMLLPSSLHAISAAGYTLSKEEGGMDPSWGGTRRLAVGISRVSLSRGKQNSEQISIDRWI